MSIMNPFINDILEASPARRASSDLNFGYLKWKNYKSKLCKYNNKANAKSRPRAPALPGELSDNSPHSAPDKVGSRSVDVLTSIGLV